jgi:tRNA 2-thiouridine synthesizing protein A
MHPAPDEPAPIDLDLTGLKCPLPVLHARRALRRLPPGSRLIVTCTDPLAAIDIPHMVREEGDRLEVQETVDGALRFRIRRNPATP